jgi:hypothetical protein
MDEWEAEVNIIRSNTVSAKSKQVYINSNINFILWLYDHKRHLLTDEFIETINDNLSKSSIKQLLNQQEIHPIRFDSIDASDYMTWIVSLRTASGGKPGYSSYNGHRSAFFNLFRNYGKTMSVELASELSNHFKGLKRATAQEVVSGERSIKVGMDPLPFSLYRILCKTFLGQTNKEFIFGHNFMIICWNLMCRSANAVNIKHQHMEWVEDALCIYFAQQKNDQNGERPRDPRHIYPNPLIPEICPILSLGLYWLTFSFADGSFSLYPGNDQYDRFRKILRRSCKIYEVEIELARRGMICEIKTSRNRSK